MFLSTGTFWGVSLVTEDGANDTVRKLIDDRAKA
jgi:hypothetical protein